MVKLIPAHIENGQIVPDAPLPEAASIREVAIQVTLAEPEATAADSGLATSSEERMSAFMRLTGLMKGHFPDDVDYKTLLGQLKEERHP